MSLALRPAAPGHAPLVHAFVCELADYEDLRHEVQATPEGLDAALFGPAPRLFCEIAEWDGQPAGFALWYYTFSSFVGRHGIYLEDLFVRPAFRSRGIARALMRRLAGRCVAEELGRFEWTALDWNEPALRFYRSIDAVAHAEWIHHRLSGAALAALAQAADEMPAR